MDQNMTPNTPENMPERPSGDSGSWKAPKQEKKRDNRLPVVAGLIGGLSVALIVALLFVTGTVGASPAKKYEKLQKKWLDEVMEKHTSGKEKKDAASVQSDQAIENLAKSYTIKLSLTEECKTLLGMDIIDQMDISGDILYDRLKENAYVTADVNLNGGNLFQIETIMDTAYQILFARIPQLSEEYLSMDIMDYMEEEGYDSLAPGGYGDLFGESIRPTASALSPELMEELLLGLKDIWVAHAPKNVTLQKNCQKELSGIKVKVDLYEAAWTELELTDCLLEMLKWLQDQKEFEAYVIQNSGMEIAEYRSGLSEVIRQLEQRKELLTVEEAQEKLLTVRLGGDQDAGYIEIQTSGMESPVLQSVWTKGKGGKSEGYLQFVPDMEDRFSFHYNSEPDGDGKKGVITMEFVNMGEAVSAELVYDGYQTGSDGSFHCHAVLNSEAFQGIGIGVEIDTTDEKQSFILELLMGNLSLGELELSISDRAYTDFEIPNQSYEVTDEEQVSAYLELCDIEGFLGGILENPDIDQLIQFVFGADMNGAMLKEALLQELEGTIGEIGGDLPDEVYEDKEEERQEPSEADGGVSAETEFSGFTGYAADTDGWVSFDPLREEVLAAGKASTGYTVFPGKLLADILPEFQALAEETYGDQIKEGEPYESNQIYGYEPYVSSYYTKMVEWYEQKEDMMSYLSIAADTVTEEIQGVEVGDVDLERGCALMAKAVAAVSGADAAEIEASLQKSIEEEGDYVSIGNIGIFWYTMAEGYITLSAYPLQ